MYVYVLCVYTHTHTHTHTHTFTLTYAYAHTNIHTGTGAGNAGGDIDDMLNSRDNAGESVLSPLSNASDTEWNIPDLNLIFRPPKFLMEVSFAIE